MVSQVSLSQIVVNLPQSRVNKSSSVSSETLVRRQHCCHLPHCRHDEEDHCTNDRVCNQETCRSASDKACTGAYDESCSNGTSDGNHRHMTLFKFSLQLIRFFARTCHIGSNGLQVARGVDVIGILAMLADFVTHLRREARAKITYDFLREIKRNMCLAEGRLDTLYFQADHQFLYFILDKIGRRTAPFPRHHFAGNQIQSDLCLNRYAKKVPRPILLDYIYTRILRMIIIFRIFSKRLLDPPCPSRPLLQPK